MAGTFSDMLTDIKTNYSPKAVEVLMNAETPFLRQLPKDLPAGATFGDKGVLKFNVVDGLPENVGFHADNDSMPVPYDRSSIQFTLTPVIFSATTGIGEMTRHAANSSQSAFNGGEVNRRVDETVKNISKHMEQMFVATHGTGRVGVVETDGASYFTLYAPWSQNLIRKNARISVRTSDGGDTVRDDCDFAKVTKVVKSTRSVYYTFDAGDSDKTVVDGDSVHIVTKAAQTSLSSIAPNGLRGLVDDGTLTTYLHSVLRSSYPAINSNVVDKGTLTYLSEQLMIEAVNMIRYESDKMPNAAWFGLGQARMYLRFVRPDRRTTTGGELPSKLETGWREEQLVHVFPGGSVTIRVSPDIYPREMYFLDMTSWLRYEAKPLGWLDDDVTGQPPLRLIPGTNTFKAGWFSAMNAIVNIGLSNPKAQAVIRNLTDPDAGDTITDL
jgi:hypothetical protein